MTGTVAEASSPLLLELHGALTLLDRRVRGLRFDELSARVEAVRSGLDPLTEASDALADKLRALRDSLGTAPSEPARADWLAFRTRVQPHYEAVVSDLLRERVSVPSLRPSNYARNALHLASSSFGLFVVEASDDPATPALVAGGFTVAGWTLEALRVRFPAVNEACMRAFGRTAHPHEAHRVNSATWYATALLLIALARVPAAAAVALATLGLGDPAAAILGRRFGRTKLMHGRTLEGTLAFVVVAGLAATLALRVLHPERTLGVSVAAACAGALAGAVAELTSRRLDDNFTIPLAAFAAAAAALSFG